MADKKGTLKTYFVEYDKVHTGIRAKKILKGEDFILFSGAYNPNISKILGSFEKEGTNIQSLIVKVKANNSTSAELIANRIRYKVASYLAGVFQVSFFFIDSGFNYQIYDRDPIALRANFQMIEPLTDGQHVLYSLGGIKKYDVLVDQLPDFKKYEKFENLFYLWRSASDGCNELGWRFLNYFRIIELITKRSLGRSKRNRRVYGLLPDEVKEMIDFDNFDGLVVKWRNTTAHGNIPNSVIPANFHGEHDSHPDLFKLFELVRLLIKKHISG